MSGPSVAVVSAFEAELQPILAASAAGSLRGAGAEVTGWDAGGFPLDFPGGDFDLVLVSIPSFEGIESGSQLAARFKAEGARRVLVFGQYAWLNVTTLARAADGVIVDEPEGMAADLVAYARGEVTVDQLAGVVTSGHRVRPKRHATQYWQVPARDLFPPIAQYPAHSTKFGLLGNIEATRGCHHRCSYCAVYASYGVAAIPIDSDVILADATQLAAQGARHFVFVDAEFFNTRRHALTVMEAVAKRLGPVTFELTTRFDHILEFESELNRMTELGLRVVTSALEFPSDKLLQILDKGIDVQGIKQAIRVANAAGIELRPSFITFTPWVGLDEIQALDVFLDETGIAVDPTARQTRLLLYKGSPLLGSRWLDGVELVDHGFYYDWKHPDPAVDELWAERHQQAVKAGAGRCCVRC
ncbi:radical SAM protein [Nonomuraea sp. NPDC002799]